MIVTKSTYEDIEILYVCTQLAKPACAWGDDDEEDEEENEDPVDVMGPGEIKI